MSDIEKPGATLDKPATQRSAGNRFGDLGDRFARALGATERTYAAAPTSVPSREPGDVVDREQTPSAESLSRFRLAWRGYERAAVDEYVAQLERDLSAYQAQSRSRRSVTEEIERIGDETTAILQVAHEQAEAVTRRAQAEADRCVAEARSHASAITDDAKRQLQSLDSETDSIWRERARLIADVNTLSDSLSSLARDAADRFPPEVDDGQQSAPGLTEPAGQQSPPGLTEPATGLVNRDPSSDPQDV
jgi:DivIVA domain-containing protein